MAIQAWVEITDGKSKADILSQLQDLGYEITQRTFYRHCALGKCRTGKGGLFTRRLVKAYAEAEGLIRHGADPEDTEGPNSALSVEKQRLENEKLRIHNQIANCAAEYKGVKHRPRPQAGQDEEEAIEVVRAELA